MASMGKINMAYATSLTDVDQTKLSERSVQNEQREQSENAEEQTSRNNLTAAEKLLEKRSVNKNLAYMYVAVLFIASPMYALINSASSLLASNGIGVLSLTVLGATQVVAAATLGSYTCKVWGVKRIIIASFILTIFYVLSFFYPHLESAIIGSAFMGLGYTLVITSTFMYGNMLGLWYGVVTSCNLDTVLVLMSGAINSAFGGGFLFGNGLYYYILYPASPDVTDFVANSTEDEYTDYDLTANQTEDAFGICGANYCNEDLTHMTTMEPPEQWRYYTLMGVFASMATAGTVVSFFVRDFSEEVGCSRRKKKEFLFMVVEPWKLLKDPRGYLLIVITTFIGVEQAFVFSEFTQAFVSCVIGIQQVGLVMLVFGFVQITTSALLGVVVKYTGRIFLVLFTIVIFMTCFVVLLTWRPDPEYAKFFYIIAVLWGMADAILLPVVFSVYGLLFEDNIEGSFALGNFWFSLGYLLSFGWSPHLCIYVELYILIVLAIIGTSCYISLEMLNRKTGSLDLTCTVPNKWPSDLVLVIPINYKRGSVPKNVNMSPR